MKKTEKTEVVLDALPVKCIITVGTGLAGSIRVAYQGKDRLVEFNLTPADLDVMITVLNEAKKEIS